jgi:lipoyl(octanoyl) transferase
MTYQQPNRDISIIDLGLIGYQEAWDFQEKMFAELLALKKENRDATNPVNVPNYLILCEHPPVYTLGKSGKEENLLLSNEELGHIGATYFRINRGGDITHHGPGQLVVYPLLDLENFFTDIHLYLRKLEDAVIQTLFTLGIHAGRYPSYTGVWIQPEDSSARKICAMGVKCSRWVTMHGIALNVKNDLSYFNHIIPCGIEDKAVTSIQKELPGFPISMELVKQLFLKNFEKEFDAHLLNNQ